MIGLPCARCARAAVHRHHLEGRDLGGAYFSPACTIPVCQRCHNLLHVARGHAGLDGLDDPFVALRRLAHDLVLCGTERPDELRHLPGWSLSAIGLAIPASLARVLVP